jgi:hypothetical protein
MIDTRVENTETVGKTIEICIVRRKFVTVTRTRTVARTSDYENTIINIILIIGLMDALISSNKSTMTTPVTASP